MRSAKKRSALRVLAAIAILAPLTRALPQSAPTPQPANRVVQPIEPLNVSRLKGNVPPRALPQYDQGPVAPSFLLSDITIEFNLTAQQQQDLAQLLKDQQDHSSANYHKWLTPEQYAARFGLSASDIAAITTWLTQQGFTVVYVARGRNYIAFQGTAAQVQNTFQTQIHRFVVNGEQHFANVSEPAIPAALAGVVLGISGLHDFTPKPLLKRSPVILDGTDPQPDAVEQVNPLTPSAFASIYDVAPLYAAGFSGSGITIAIVGEAEPDFSDVATFRTKFSLPPNVPQAILAGADPGVKPLNSGVVVEEILDLEWAGAVAPGATLLYVYSSGVDVALTYTIDNNLAPIISMSYGGCEADGESNIFEPQLQKAAAQGMTLLISSGDSGPAECDPSEAAVAMNGLAVQYPSSSPEVTAVGGTSFQQSSGTGYIPEMAWNDTPTLGLAAGGGGASAIFAKPSWQTGAGVPSDGFRDVPDVALAASPVVDPYSVIYNKGVTGYVGGTSASAPSTAGIVALLNQYLIANGALSAPGLGIINPVLYQFSLTSPGSFHDITSGNTLVPCEINTPDCTTGQFGYYARPGYDEATGLGSVDANNLAVFWSTAPFISFSATTLTFAAQYAGSTSAAQTVTLTNHGNGPLGISGITTSGDFAQTNTCGTSIPVSGSCTISVTFTPTVLGPDTGSINIAESPAGNPLTVNLTGTSISSVSLSPASLTFSPQLVGTASAPQTVTLTNSGPSPITIYYIVSGNFFSETNTCGASIAAAGTCTITVTFKPISYGSQTGSMDVYDSAVGSPQMISFTGSGFSALSFSPPSLAFGSQLAGIASASQTVTLTNNGAIALNITGFEASSGFAETNTCGTPVAVAGTCTIAVNFKPVAIGAQSGAIIITDNEFDSPQYLNLTGTGISTVGLSPPSLNFPSQLVDTTSAPQMVTLTNAGNTPLVINSISASGNFAETNNCAGSISPSGTCSISVTFTPTSTLILPAAITIADNAIGSPQAIQLAGSAFTDVVLSANTVGFAAVPLGGTSLTTTVNVTNAGSTALAIASIAVAGPNSGDFTETQSCTPSLAAGATCRISINFQPSALGIRNAMILITDNATDSPQTITLQAEGADFSLAAAGSLAATVAAGQTAIYSLQVNPTQNLAGPMAMACSGAPAQSTCTVAPATLVVDGSPMSFQVGVATIAPSSLPHTFRGPSPPWQQPKTYFGTMLLFFLLLSAGLLAGNRSFTVSLWMGTAIVLISLATLLIACGGGNSTASSEGSGTATTGNTGTPAGTYNLTVTGTAFGAARSISLTLTVN